MGDEESEQAAALLKMIGDLERISDHAVNVLNSTEELRQKDTLSLKTLSRNLTSSQVQQRRFSI